jgi:hypothetical protein
MMASRRTQPYKKAGGRAPGAALNAMLKGRSPGGWNPKDIERQAMLVKAGKKRRRPARPQRPARPSR